MFVCEAANDNNNQTRACAANDNDFALYNTPDATYYYGRSRRAAKKSGAKYWCGGRPCLEGHGVRYANGGNCVECCRLQGRSFRQDNPGYYKSRYTRKISDEQRVRNKIAAGEQKREREKARRSTEEWKTKERLRTAGKRSDKRKEYEKRYRIANATKIRAKSLNYSARKAGAEGTHTQGDIERIHANQNYVCAACSIDTIVTYHVDHINPLSRGGSNWPENLQILCPSCNMTKGGKNMDEFRSYRKLVVSNDNTFSTASAA